MHQRSEARRAEAEQEPKVKRPMRCNHAVTTAKRALKGCEKRKSGESRRKKIVNIPQITVKR